MLETTRRATNNMREHIATHLRQNLLQQNLVANKKQAKSAKQLRDLAIKRFIFILLSIALLVGSVASIIVVLLDTPQKAIKDYGADITGSDTFGELLPSIIVTLVNSISPVLIKIFVRVEQCAACQPTLLLLLHPRPPPPPSSSTTTCISYTGTRPRTSCVRRSSESLASRCST